MKSARDTETKQKLLSKVKFIEDELGSEFYDILREDEQKDDLPSVVPEFAKHPKIDAEFEAKTQEENERIETIKRNAVERAVELDTLDRAVEDRMDRMEERQEEMKRQMHAEYAHREKG